MLADMTVLHARPFRGVALEARAGAAVVVKRFHHPNPLLARFDRGRARRELDALVELERAGLSVPKPLGMRATEGGWELSLAAVPGARTLQELLESGALPAGGWERLLARLGELLARLQVAGWEHGDLHLGNVLVDANGRPWLIDFQRARRVAPDRARCLSEVVECAALAREQLPLRMRVRFLVAWRAVLPTGLRPRLAGTELAYALEERARLRRIERVRIGLGRWLRDSSRVGWVQRGETGFWSRRDLASVSLDLALPATWIVLRGGHDEMRARWLGAARLAEHRLPVARPAAFSSGSRWSGRGAWAAFEPPENAAPSRAELLDALADRRLALARPATEHSTRGVYFLPPREPADFTDPRG